MPELPEVETLRRRLEPHLAGRRIQAIAAPDSRRFHDVAAAAGATIRGIRRYGKYLIFDLGDKQLVMHLGLTGWLCLGPAGKAPPHARAEILLDGPERLYFEDARRLGRLYVVPAGSLPDLPSLAEMGPDPLSPEFDMAKFVAEVVASGRPIKAILLDQRVVAGLGNIYSDEALWAARIHPGRRHLSEEEANRLYDAIRDVVGRALAEGGVEDGNYQMQVHRRARKPCPRCRTPIVSETIAGRTAYYCPRCQPLSAAQAV